MSGLDDYSRFYWTVDQAGNSAISGEASNFPSFSTQDYPSTYNPYVSGEIGLGYRFYSYDPLAVPTRTPSSWLLNDKTSPFAPLGLNAFCYEDYTIDFFLKVSGESYQHIMGVEDWSIYYEDHQIHQIQGGSLHTSCICNLSGEFRHIEFNRSLGVNRIFVSGESQVLIDDLWSPIPIAESAQWHLGVIDYSLRNVDFVIDGLHFSTGVARHQENFVPQKTAYTRLVVTGIASPDNGLILFSIIPEMQVEFPSWESTIFATQNNRIRFSEDSTIALTMAPDETIPADVIDHITFSDPLELFSGFYGETVYSGITNEILIESVFDLQVQLEESTVINEGVIFDLIGNTIQLPISMEVVIEASTSNKVSFTFGFVNALELQIGFSFLNSLNADFETSFSFKNSLTSNVSLSFSFKNRILAVNEFQKNFTFFNRILTSEPVIGNPEEYTGFYFSEIHGVQ
jgi:hypothetical protein